MSEVAEVEKDEAVTEPGASDLEVELLSFQTGMNKLESIERDARLELSELHELIANFQDRFGELGDAALHSGWTGESALYR